MIFVCFIDIVVIVVLLYLTVRKGIEGALPFFIFVVVCSPEESTLPLPFFSLTTRRVAVCALVLFYFLFKRAGAPLLEKTPLKYLLLIHSAWCVLSTANSIVPVTSIKQMLSQVVEYYVLYWILVKTVSTTQTVHKILAAMVFAIFVSCIAGAFEPYTNWRVTQWFPALTHHFGMSESDGRGWRVQSTFSNYSLFGSAVAFAMIEAFYFLSIAKSNARKVYLWLALVLMFLNIYKTTSRGPWMAFIIGFCFLLIAAPRTRRYLAYVSIITVLAFVIRPGVWQTVYDIYRGSVADQTDNELASSYQYRYALWGVGQNVLARSFSREIWGYGMESFYDLHIVAPFNTNPAYPFESCDSSWVQSMVETGYVGLVLIALVILVPILRTLRDWWRIPKPDDALCLVLFINIVQYCFMMTNVAIYGWGQTGHMLWTWIALSVVYGALAQKKPVALKQEAQKSEELEFALTAARK